MTVADRIKFCEEYCTTPDGQPFSLEGREWQRDELFIPFDGWKLWPVDANHICDPCKRLAGSITEDYRAGDETRTATHKKKAKGCLGLSTNPIVVTVLNLPRQEGKTFSAASLVQSIIFREPNADITLMANSEDQVAAIFDANYRRGIEASEELSEACQVTGMAIKVEETKSTFECVSTSHASVTGRTRDVIIVDECRDVPSQTLNALLPAIRARNGWLCPHGHIKTSGVNLPNAPKVCPVCKTKTVPWYGRVILMSSAGVMDGSENDWFAELVEYLTEKPDQNAHVFVLKKKQ